MDSGKLGAVLARAIFECGDDPGRPCTRIQFMAASSGGEIPQGGFIESALARFLSRELAKLPPHPLPERS